MQPKETDSPSPIDQAIGRRINQRRRALGLTEHDLASRLGLSAAHMTAVERGEEALSAATLYAAARALQTSAAVLLGELGPGESFLLGLSEPDTLAMLQAFAAIEAADVRAALLALVQEMAEGRDFRAI